jgi:GAF domain-containing protein
MKASDSSYQKNNMVNRFTRHTVQASTTLQVLEALVQTLAANDITAVIFAPEQSGFHRISLDSSTTGENASIPEWLAVSQQTAGSLFSSSAPVLINEGEKRSDFPFDLRNLPRVLNCASVAVLPLRFVGQMAALLILGSRQKSVFSPDLLDEMTHLAEIAGEAFQKAQTLENLEKRLIIAQTLDTLIRTVSLEIDLKSLYPVIHQQVRRVIGEVDFLIALYDPQTDRIDIQYAYERGEMISLPPLKLGQGLTSILIRTRRPILLVENVEKEAARLGARQFGVPAKSWLGVPLLIAGEVIGAVVLQDSEIEHRFNEEHQDLLIALASQVAIAVRNASLLQQTRQQAEKERILGEISARLWSSTDIETILRTGILELGRALKISEGTIQLDATLVDEG